EETLIALRAIAIGLWIAPAVEKIASLSPATAGVSLRFLFRGAVIDDPDLVEARAAERDLIEIGAVSHRVDVHPVRILDWTAILVFLLRVFFATRKVQIEQFRVFGNVAVIGLVLVAVLDQMIPASPFPDDFTALLARGLDLDEAIGLQVRV